jgi:hypothetical protein
MVGFPVFVEVAGPNRGGFAPALRVGFDRSSSGAIDVQGPTATFTWTSGLVEGCPLRWTYETLKVEPCLRAEAGVLTGAGANIVAARDVTRPWVAVGAVGRAEWFFLSPLFLDVEAGLRFPLVRTRYFFDPDTTIYRPPPAGWVAGIGLGVRFL